MADVLVRLRNFEDAEAAEMTAEAIRNAGGITYLDGDDTVNVTVGNVTVENI
jgi:hypothetical protein